MLLLMQLSPLEMPNETYKRNACLQVKGSFVKMLSLDHSFSEVPDESQYSHGDSSFDGNWGHMPSRQLDTEDFRWYKLGLWTALFCGSLHPPQPGEPESRMHH
jgi:hypothetical protein